MAIDIIEVSSEKELKLFVDLPYQLYKRNKFWVPPMRNDELKALQPQTNPAMEICASKFWIALKDGKCVGRIGGIIVPLWNEKTNEKIARFSRPEFIDDEQVADALLETVGNWAKSQGMDGLMGPLGFSNLDSSGLLIEGHDWLQSVASSYHFDYYQHHYNRLGFEKEVDWIEFRVTFPDVMPEKSLKVAELIKTRFGLKVLNFKANKELNPYKEQFFGLFNQSFSVLFGTYELPDKLIRFYFSKYFPILNPKYVKMILDKEDKLAGFMFALPSLSKAMQKAGGKLLPFGWYHILKALKHPVEMDLMLTGVKPELVKMGGVSILMNELWVSAQKDGVKEVETTAMLENNPATQIWKSFDHIQHKRKRCYRKMF